MFGQSLEVLWYIELKDYGFNSPSVPGTFVLPQDIFINIAALHPGV